MLSHISIQQHSTKHAEIINNRIFILCKHLTKRKDKMATKVRQNAKQVDNDEGNNNNDSFVVPETIIVERKEGFKPSMSDAVATVTKRRPLPGIHSTCLPFGERTGQHGLSLLLTKETERDLFNETFCSRCVESRSKSTGNTSLDAHRQELMQHKKSCTDFRLVDLNSDVTRLVDGLLTTTFCSTEL